MRYPAWGRVAVGLWMVSCHCGSCTCLKFLAGWSSKLPCFSSWWFLSIFQLAEFSLVQIPNMIASWQISCHKMTIFKVAFLSRNSHMFMSVAEFWMCCISDVVFISTAVNFCQDRFVAHLLDSIQIHLNDLLELELSHLQICTWQFIQFLVHFISWLLTDIHLNELHFRWSAGLDFLKGPTQPTAEGVAYWTANTVHATPIEEELWNAHPIWGHLRFQVNAMWFVSETECAIQISAVVWAFRMSSIWRTLETQLEWRETAPPLCLRKMRSPFSSGFTRCAISFVSVATCQWHSVYIFDVGQFFFAVFDLGYCYTLFSATFSFGDLIQSLEILTTLPT